MRKFGLIATALIACGALVLSVTDEASAAKKLSYAQAYKLCKDELDKGGVFGPTLSAGARYTVGSGCMQKYGYRLKRSSKM
jgi:hypothetical protein